jgi:hypothetical protein
MCLQRRKPPTIDEAFRGGQCDPRNPLGLLAARRSMSPLPAPLPPAGSQCSGHRAMHPPCPGGEMLGEPLTVGNLQISAADQGVC